MHAFHVFSSFSSFLYLPWPRSPGPSGVSGAPGVPSGPPRAPRRRMACSAPCAARSARCAAEKSADSAATVRRRAPRPRVAGTSACSAGFLGVDSFSILLNHLSERRIRFQPWVSGGFLERRIPGKNGESTPKCLPLLGEFGWGGIRLKQRGMCLLKGLLFLLLEHRQGIDFRAGIGYKGVFWSERSMQLDLTISYQVGQPYRGAPHVTNEGSPLQMGRQVREQAGTVGKPCYDWQQFFA